jgi:hypothetical protein
MRHRRSYGTLLLWQTLVRLNAGGSDSRQREGVGLTNGGILVRTDTVNKRLLFLSTKDVNRDYPDNSLGIFTSEMSLCGLLPTENLHASSPTCLQSASLQVLRTNWTNYAQPIAH